MSDGTTGDTQNRYYYIGSDRFAFAGELAGDPLEDTLYGGEPASEESAAALARIIDAFAAARNEAIGRTISESATVNSLCKSAIQSIEDRVGIRAGSMEELWKDLSERAASRLRSYGYLASRRGCR